MFCTYILRSLKDDGFYFGYTSNIEKRLSDHNSGKTKSIKHRIPFILHYLEDYTTRQEAMKREKFFKTFAGRQWLHQHKII